MVKKEKSKPTEVEKPKKGKISSIKISSTEAELKNKLYDPMMEKTNDESLRKLAESTNKTREYESSKRKKKEKEDPAKVTSIKSKLQEYLDAGRLLAPIRMPNSPEEIDYLKKQSLLKPFVRSAYDFMLMRIQTGNRICAIFNNKLGLVAGKTLNDAVFNSDTDVQEQLKKDILDYVRRDFRRITDGVIDIYSRITLRKIVENKGSDIITDVAEMILIQQYEDQLLHEERMFDEMENMTKEIFPNEYKWLTSKFGIGPKIAALLCSKINPWAATHASSYHQYCGIGVSTTDGKAMSNRNQHLCVRPYVDADDYLNYKLSVVFDPLLRTKLIMNARQNFIREGSEYFKVYKDYRHRYDNNPNIPNHTKGHCFAMAIRVALKRFITDFWVFQRTLYKLPVTEPYEVAKLGIIHSKSDTRASM